MISLKVTAVGDEWKPRFWTDLERQFLSELDKLIENHAISILNEMRERAPRRSGRLRKGIEAEINTRLRQIVFTSKEEYSPFQDLGTGIYSENPESPRREIRPDTARTLKIPLGRLRGRLGGSPPEGGEGGESGGAEGFIFRKKIRGTRPRRFFERVFERRASELLAEVEGLMERYGFQ